MTPATGNRRKFHKGPPPYPGWWNVQASIFGSDKMWGWFDGVGWSVFCGARTSAYVAGARAAIKGAEYAPMNIRWSDYWPANARVPRINPNKETA